MPNYPNPYRREEKLFFNFPSIPRKPNSIRKKQKQLWVVFSWFSRIERKIRQVSVVTTVNFLLLLLLSFSI